MPESTRASVEIRVPAESAYVSVLRTTAAGLAARLDFTLDDVDDLRVAVGEAASVALERATPGTDLQVSFWLAGPRMNVTISTRTASPEPLGTDSFAWQVLTTLAKAGARVEDGVLEITIAVEPTPLGPTH